MTESSGPAGGSARRNVVRRRMAPLLGVALALSLGLPVYCYFFESPAGASPFVFLWILGILVSNLLLFGVGLVTAARHDLWSPIGMALAAPVIFLLFGLLFVMVHRERRDLAVAWARQEVERIVPQHPDEMELHNFSCEVGRWRVIFRAHDGRRFAVFMTERGRTFVVNEITQYDSESAFPEDGEVTYRPPECARDGPRP